MMCGFFALFFGAVKKCYQIILKRIRYNKVYFWSRIIWGKSKEKYWEIKWNCHFSFFLGHSILNLKFSWDISKHWTFLSKTFFYLNLISIVLFVLKAWIINCTSLRVFLCLNVIELFIAWEFKLIRKHFKVLVIYTWKLEIYQIWVLKSKFLGSCKA